MSQTYNLQLEISSSVGGAVDGIKSLGREIKNLEPNIKIVADQLDRLEKGFKKFGRELTQNVTAPIAALAGLSLKNIYDTAVDGRGTSAMNEFAASIQNVKKEFDLLLKDIGNQIAPTITKFINLLSGLMAEFRKLSPETKSLIITFAAIAAAVGPVALAISSFLSVAVQLTKAVSFLVTIGPAVVAFFTSPIVAAIALAAIIGGLINLMLNLNRAGVGVGEAIVKSLDLAATYLEKTFYPVLAWTLRKIDQNIKDTFDRGVVSKILGDKAEQKTALAEFADSVDVVGDLTKKKFEDLKNDIDSTLATVGTSIEKTMTYGISEFIDNIKSKISELSKTSVGPLVTKADEEEQKARLERMAAAIKRIQDEVKKEQEAFRAKQEEIERMFVGGMVSGLLDFAEGAKTAEQAFSDFARSFLRQITQMILEQQLLNALRSTSWFGGASGALAGAAGFANGGYVSGAGTGTSDSIPAWLSNGEYVMTASAVRKFGAGFFNRINSLAKGPSNVTSKIGGFAEGGFVSSSQQAPQVVIENSGSEKTVARTEFDPISAVTTVFIEDINKNGPISKTIQSSYGIKRGGFR